MTKNDSFQKNLTLAQKGDMIGFARVLTIIERQGLQAIENKELFSSKSHALRVGITGPPGAGKSTLVGRLISWARAKGMKVGVLAVDPSSPFTHGAILADRIRYSEHSLDEGVFVRSLGTRGSLGGLSSSAYLMARAFDLCQFDLLLVETVGVGQSELEIVNLADRTAVVLVPESGDAVQAMKAGLLEISDIFVVNKSDRPGADTLVNELQMSMELTGDQVEIFKTVASQGLGVDELALRLFAPLKREEKELRRSEKRWKAEAKALLRQSVEAYLNEELKQLSGLKDLLSSELIGLLGSKKP